MLASTLFWWFLAGFGVSFSLLAFNFFCAARSCFVDGIKRKNVALHFILGVFVSLSWIGLLITGLIWFLTFLGVIHPTL